MPDETAPDFSYAAEDHSFTTFDAVVDEIVRLLQPKTILDVGAGAGKYGRRLRQVMPDAYFAAIEMNADDIREHQLHTIYDRIIEHDASELMMREPNFLCDVAILGDVIEHLPKSAGLDFLNWLHYRAAYIIIITPEHMAMGGNKWFLAHNSLWSKRDFGWHDSWAFDQLTVMQLFVLRGAQPNPITLKDLVADVNAARIPVAIEQFSRFCTLELRQDVTTLPTAHIVWRPA